MKLAVSGEGLGSVCTLEKILEIIKKNGIRAIEIWPENIPVRAGKQLIHKRFYANRDVEKARDILEQAGVKVACVCFGAGFVKELAENRELFSSELVRAVRTAHALGAKVVNHYCYFVAMGDVYSVDELKAYYADAIKEAEKYKIYLALENEAHDITKNPVQMKKIVQAMDSEYFRTNYDATNYYQAGYEGFPYAYEVLKDLIVHVHIKNGCVYCPEYGHREECKGSAMTGRYTGNYIYYPVASDGAVNIDGMIRRLHRDGYHGYCSLEPHTIPELCIEYYKAESEYLYTRGFQKNM